MEPSRNAVALLSDSFKTHKKKPDKRRYDNTCDVSNEVIETIRKEKEQFLVDSEFEGAKLPIEVSLDSALIHDSALSNEMIREESYNVLRASSGFTIPEHSDAPYQESVDRLHNSLNSYLVPQCKSPKKKYKKKSGTGNIKSQIAEKDLNNSMSSNVTEDNGFGKKKKKRKKKHSAAVELENEAVHTDEINNEDIEELGIAHSLASLGCNISEHSNVPYQEFVDRLHNSLNSDLALECKSSEEKNKKKSGTDNIKSQIADKDLNNSMSSNVTEDNGFGKKKKKRKKKHSAAVELENEAIHTNEIDKDLNYSMCSNVTEDYDFWKKKKKRKKKHSAAVELENEAIHTNEIDNEGIEELSVVHSSGVTNRTEVVLRDQKKERKRKKHFLDNNFENIDLSVTNSIDKLQNSSCPVHSAEEIYPVNKKQQKAETIKNVTQNEDKDLDNILDLNATEIAYLTEDGNKRKKKKKKQKCSLGIELNNDDVLIDKDETDVGIISSSDVTTHVDEDQENLKKRKKGKRLFNNELFVTNSIDKFQNSSHQVHTAEEIFPQKKKQQKADTAENAIQNEDKNLDNFLNSKAADVAEDSDYRKKKKRKVSVELENEAFNTDGIEESGSIFLGTNHTEAALKDQEKKRKRKKHLLNDEFENMDLSVTNSIDTVEEILPKKKKQEKADAAENEIQNEDKNLDSFLNSNATKAADVAEDCDFREKKQKGSVVESDSDLDVFETTSTSNFIVPVLNSEEDPVDFTIPELHASESVSSLSKEKRASFESKGIEIKDGRWLNSEDDILRRNYNKFCHEFKTNDPHILLGLGQSRQNTEVAEFLKAKHFYVRLAQDLNNRTLGSVYSRARILFHPLRDGRKTPVKDLCKLKEAYNRYGNKWNQIGDTLNKSAFLIRESHRWNDKPVNKGPWNDEEENNLITAIKAVAKTPELSPKLIKKISWQKVSDLVPTRNSSQCRLHWGESMAFDPEVERSTWDKSKDRQLLEVIKSKRLTDATEIDWEEIHESFKDAAPSYMFLQKRYRKLKSLNEHFVTMNGLFVKR